MEHIAIQLAKAIETNNTSIQPGKLLVTGGGANNTFLIQVIQEKLNHFGITVELPSKEVIDYKEAIIMAFIGALRFRENNTTLASVTGASRDSIGGAFWIGQEY